MNILKTTRFGVIDVAPSQVITFPESIPGFNEKKFTLICPDDLTSMVWLQSLDDGALAFPMLRAAEIMPNYTKLLPLAAYEEAFVILYIPSDITEMTCNTRAPIIIDRQSNEGKQQLLEDKENTFINLKIYPTLKKHIMGLPV